jgi:hypothetical protein
MIYNGTGTSFDHEGLEPVVTYYYQAWSYTNWTYNPTIHQWSDDNNTAGNQTFNSSVVTTNASTGVEETNATLHGYLVDDGGADCVVWFEYGTTESYGTNTTNQSKTSGQEFSDEITSLSQGQLYHYRAISSTIVGLSNGTDEQLLTKPLAPTGLTTFAYNATQINLNWTTGVGANNTYIEYNTSSTWDIGEGTLLYNGSATTFNHSGIDSGDHFYYQAWSYTEWNALHQYSDLYDSADEGTYINSTVLVNATTGVEETNATLHGYLVLAGDGNATCGFRVGTTIGDYSVQNLTVGSFNDGEEFSVGISSLTEGQIYFVQAWAHNGVFFNVSPTYDAFLTKPLVTTNLDAIAISATVVNLTWTKGTGANNTYIEFKNVSDVWTRGEGTMIYNGTGTWYNHEGLEPAGTYYYQAWSYTEWSYNPTLHQWSDDNASDSVTTVVYPIEPSSFVASTFNKSAIELTWTKEFGADKTTIVYKQGSSPPTNISDGTIGYNGTASTTTIGSLLTGTLYSFSAWAWNDTYSTYSLNFSNTSARTNNPLVFSSESPSNKTVDVDKTQSTFSITIEDQDGDTFNWTIQTSPNYGSDSANGASNGSKSCSLSTPLPYSTNITIYVNATDGYDWTNETFWFIVRDEHVPDAPGSFTATATSRFTMDVSWVKGSKADYTYIRYKSGGTPPTDRDDGTFLYNGTGVETNVGGLTMDTQYSFKAWSWNVTDEVFSSAVATDSETTYSNQAPSVSSPSPSNGASGVNIDLATISASVTDGEGDLMDWTIETSPDIGDSSANNEGNGTKSCSISGLVNNTEYTWWVNVTDGYDSTSQSYTFTTTVGTLGIVTNNPTAVEENSATMHGTLTDDGGEPCSVWFQYGLTPGYGSTTSTQTKSSGQSFSVSLSGLPPGTKYYYRAVADNPSASVSYGSQKTFLTKPSDAPQSFTATSYSDTRIDITWTKPSGATKTLIVRKENSYPASRTDGTVVYNGTATSYSDTGLPYLRKYYYKAWSVATGSVQFSDNTSQFWNWTLPRPPTNVSAVIEESFDLNITWTISPDADTTVVRYSESSYPTDQTEGTLIYNGTGDFTVDVNISSPIYYSTFTYVNYSGVHLYSRYEPVPFGGMFINVYDETTKLNITGWDVFVSDQSGSQTYERENASNTLLIPTNDVPIGEKIIFQFSATGYKSRYLYLDIEEDNWYDIDVMLPDASVAELYLITVINQYDFPVEGVLVKTLARNATGQYVVVSQLYTDANGQISNLYLIPETIYHWELSKTGYTTAYPDYIPDPEVNSHTFRIEYAGYEPEDVEHIFENLIWSVYPEQRYHTTGFTCFFNVTSTDNKLEYMKMIIWYYNSSTSIWDILYNSTTYTSSGDSMSYYIPNITGEYHVSCYVKKTNFSEVDVMMEGSRIFFISWGGLSTSPVFGAIPDWLYVLVVVIIMIVTMGYLLPYAGVATGYIGIGIFGFALALKPDLAFSVGPGDPITAWFVLLLTALVYTVALFLWSRI